MVSVTVHTDIHCECHTNGKFHITITNKQLYRPTEIINLSTDFRTNYDRGLKSVLPICWSLHQSTNSLHIYRTLKMCCGPPPPPLPPGTSRDFSLHPQQVTPNLVLLLLVSHTLFLHDLTIPLSNRKLLSTYFCMLLLLCF